VVNFFNIFIKFYYQNVAGNPATFFILPNKLFGTFNEKKQFTLLQTNLIL